MPSVLAVTTAGTGSLSGQIQIADEGVTNLRRLYWPAGINALNRHGSGYTYGNRNYLMGAWSSNLVIDENFRVMRQGIIPPQSPPSVTAGGGATEQICFLSFYDAYTDERSSLSEGTSITGNTTRTWASLPTEVPGEIAVIEGLVDITGAAPSQAITQAAGSVTTFSRIRPGDKVAREDIPTQYAVVRSIADDQNMVVDGSLANGAGVALLHKPVFRPTHLELWVSVAGALPRLSSRVPLGVTGWTETVGTLSLGEAFLDNFEPFPLCVFGIPYGDRQWAAGNSRNQDTLYGSALFFHERWDGLSFKTRFGEPITALIKLRDVGLACCPSSSYLLRGYTVDDLTFEPAASDLGCLGPHTFVVVRDMAFIWNNQGFWLYNGAWHRLSLSNQSKYIELAKRFPREYESGKCVYDPEWDSIYFIPNYDEFSTYDSLTTLEQEEMVVWVVGNIMDIVGAEAGGFSQPAWSWDSPYVLQQPNGMSGQSQMVSAAYLTPTATSIGQFIRVGRDGSVTEEADPRSGGLVGMELWSAHSFLGENGGDEEEGHEIKDLAAYFYGDYAECTWRVYAGGEYAQGDDIRRRMLLLGPSSDLDINALQTPHVQVIPASLSEVTVGGTVDPDDPNLDWGVHEALTHHFWRKEIPGRGFTHRFFFEGSNVEFYGFGGYYGPGRVPRALTYATGDD